MTARTNWSAKRRPDMDAARAAADDEARLTGFESWCSNSEPRPD